MKEELYIHFAGDENGCCCGGVEHWTTDTNSKEHGHSIEKMNFLGASLNI